MKYEDAKKRIDEAIELSKSLSYSKKDLAKSLDRLNQKIMDLSDIRLSLEVKSSRLSSDKIIIYNEGLEQSSSKPTLREREQAAQSSDEYLDIRQAWEDNKALIKHVTTVIETIEYQIKSRLSVEP